MNFAEFQAEDRRLTVLKLLEKSASYTANQFLLQAALRGFGHDVGADRLQTDLAWLAEQGLVDVAQTAAVRIATLTQRGLDVAAGRAIVPGVKRPAPGE